MEVTSDGSEMQPAPVSCIRKTGKHGYLLYATGTVRGNAVAIQLLLFMKTGFQDRFVFVNKLL